MQQETPQRARRGNTTLVAVTALVLVCSVLVAGGIAGGVLLTGRGTAPEAAFAGVPAASIVPAATTQPVALATRLPASAVPATATLAPTSAPTVAATPANDNTAAGRSAGLVQPTSTASAAGTPPKPAATSKVRAVEETADLQAEQQQHAKRITGYRQRFFETFQEQRSKRWTQGDNPQIGLKLVDNIYRLTLKQPGVTNWEPWRQTTFGKNYIVELGVVVRGASSGTAAVGIGFDEQGDAGNASYFVLRNDRTWQIRTLRNGKLVPTLSTAPTKSAHIVAGANKNTLWVVRLPDRTEYWVNAAPVAVGPASGAKSGRVGVVGWAEANLTAPVAVDVDDLLIWEPR